MLTNGHSQHRWSYSGWPHNLEMSQCIRFFLNGDLYIMSTYALTFHITSDFIKLELHTRDRWISVTGDQARVNHGGEFSSCINDTARWYIPPFVRQEAIRAMMPRPISIISEKIINCMTSCGAKTTHANRVWSAPSLFYSFSVDTISVTFHSWHNMKL